MAQDRSVSTPPRSAIARPAARANSSRGRTPAAKTTRPASMTSPSLSVTRTESSRRTAGRADCVVPADSVGADARVHGDAEFADHPAQQRAAGLVELLGHQLGCHLDDMGGQPERAQRVGGLQAEQTATDDDAGRRWPASGARARRRGSRRGRRGCGRHGSPVGRGRAPEERTRRSRWPARGVVVERSPSAVSRLGVPVDPVTRLPSRSSTRSSPRSHCPAARAGPGPSARCNR